MRLLTILLLVSILISCNQQTKVALETKEITLNNLTKDSVIVFLKGNDTLDIYREVEIIENENTDTVELGYTVIPPKELGKLWFIQIDLSPSNAAYLNDFTELDPTKPWSFAKLFTIGLDNKKYDRALKKITLRLRVSTKPLKWKTEL